LLDLKENVQVCQRKNLTRTLTNKVTSVKIFFTVSVFVAFFILVLDIFANCQSGLAVSRLLFPQLSFLLLLTDPSTSPSLFLLLENGKLHFPRTAPKLPFAIALEALGV
jgi:hypothetical protein